MDQQELLKLRNWFLEQRRDLPWRQNPTPYAVWVSEVMLQQTQVSVVIPYFERWMHRFPTIHDLANASIEAVLKEWEGLGYYSRARNLHEGARYIVDNFNGHLPDKPEHLQKIKGIGPYTMGAILSFAFHQRKAAVDGNVLRVLARYYALTDDIGKNSSVKKIHELAETLLPDEEPWIVSEALIELGATRCGRSPQCERCPLRSTCMAYLKGMTDQLPFKTAKVPTQILYRAVAVVVSDHHLLIGRGAKGKVMADLCEFPYLDMKESKESIEVLQSHFQNTLNVIIDWKASLSEVSHSFTRYRAQLFPQLFLATRRPQVQGYTWHSLEELKNLPFSSGHRRIFGEVQQKLIKGL